MWSVGGGDQLHQWAEFLRFAARNIERRDEICTAKNGNVTSFRHMNKTLLFTFFHTKIPARHKYVLIYDLYFTAKQMSIFLALSTGFTSISCSMVSESLMLLTAAPTLHGYTALAKLPRGSQLTRLLCLLHLLRPFTVARSCRGCLRSCARAWPIVFQGYFGTQSLPSAGIFPILLAQIVK